VVEEDWVVVRTARSLRDSVHMFISIGFTSFFYPEVPNYR